MIRALAWEVGTNIDQKSQEGLFQTLLETAVDGIMVIDDAGCVLVYSPACERLFGYAQDDVIGKMDRQVKEIVARARANEGRALETMRETGYYLARGFATIVKSIDPGRIYVGGEITTGWDLMLSTVREAMREQSLTKETGETDIRIVPLGEYPRLRGAAALVSSPAFAAPTIA
jgi:predicted NBD/HSP70 family sugar kinase